MPLRDCSTENQSVVCTPSNAPVSSVFDHSLSGNAVIEIPRSQEFFEDDLVIAFDAERGVRNGVHADNCYAKNQNRPQFTLHDVNYRGVGSGGRRFLCYDGHPGIDFVAETGTPVFAAADGEVIEAQWDDVRNIFGFYVKIDHGEYHTLYAHLNSMPSVSERQDVRAGDRIGSSGCTGACEGPHLHFQVRRIGGAEQVNVDPYGHWNILSCSSAPQDVLWLDWPTGTSTGTNACPGGTGPDLVVESPAVSETTLKPGERTTVSATVRNQGTAESARTRLRYYWSTDPTLGVGDTEVGSDSVLSLDPDETSYESAGVRAPSEAGIFYYSACVDPVSGETNTGNNCSATVSVTVAAAGGPDLVVESPTVSETTVIPEERIGVSATVRNQGTAESLATRLYYYWSTDRTINTADANIDSDFVRSLDPEETSGESHTVSAPSEEGVYYYGACVDSVAGETNAENNCSSAVALTVTAAGGPDLVVESFTVSEATVEPDERIQVSATVRNQGTEESRAWLRYYWSTDPVLGADDTEVGSHFVGRLDPEETGSESRTVSAPSEEGVYYYGACVDPEAGETNTENNCSSTVAVTVTAAGGADLVVESFTVSETAVKPDERIQVSATVRNQGTAESRVTWLRYYWSRDPTLGADDTEIGSDFVGRLGPEERSDGSRAVNAPSHEGIYYYGACVEEVVGETDTRNNCSSEVRVEVTERIASDDRAGLEALYHATNGPNWANNVNWLSDAPLGEWYGVRTNAQGRVVELHLYENGLIGGIPPELGRLTELQDFVVLKNELAGRIPPELGELTNLWRLWLQDNELTGWLPPELGELTNLRVLLLDENDLTGPIPPELARLTNLEYLSLVNTAICVPENAALQAWLATIANFYSSGLNCEGTECNPRAENLPTPGGSIWAVHITDLRICVDAARTGVGLTPFAWSDPNIAPGVTAVRAVHMREIRHALDAAYARAGVSAPRYTDRVIQRGVTEIKAVHFSEIFDYGKELIAVDVGQGEGGRR